MTSTKGELKKLIMNNTIVNSDIITMTSTKGEVKNLIVKDSDITTMTSTKGEVKNLIVKDSDITTMTSTKGEVNDIEIFINYPRWFGRFNIDRPSIHYFKRNWNEHTL
jgi:hypothetical protein